jgi:hypothetical protein
MSTSTAQVTVLVLRPGNVNKRLDDGPNVHFVAGTTVAEARAAFANERIDHVVIGGFDIDEKLALIREILQDSTHTTVHLNREDGGASFQVFVRHLLDGLDARQMA